MGKQEYQQVKLESQHAQDRLADRGRQDQVDQLHLQERALALQKETTSLVQQQQAVAFEREAAHQAGRRAREMELQAHQQIAALGQQRARGQQEWQITQQECAVLIKEKDLLLQDLGTCQDLIREEAQVHRQEQEQSAARIHMLQVIADSPVRDEQTGARDAATRVALMSRGGESPLHFGMNATGACGDGGSLLTYSRPDDFQYGERHLRESDLGSGQPKAKDPKDGERPPWRSEFGLGQPVGSALVPIQMTNSHVPLGRSDANFESPLYRHEFKQSMAWKRKNVCGCLLSIQEIAHEVLLHLIVNTFVWYHWKIRGAKSWKRWKFLPIQRSRS